MTLSILRKDDFTKEAQEKGIWDRMSRGNPLVYQLEVQVLSRSKT